MSAWWLFVVLLGSGAVFMAIGLVFIRSAHRSGRLDSEAAYARGMRHGAADERLDARRRDLERRMSEADVKPETRRWN